MKYLSLALLLVLSTGISSCTDNETFIPSANGGWETPTPPVANDAINSKLFDVINLDYPGLEKVKAYYEEEQYYFAAKALLEYYRMRTNVINPGLSLVNINVSADDQLKADHALNYRFFINNYYENPEEKLPYLFKKGNKIDWTFDPLKHNEFRSQLHRHQWMASQAKVYRKTNDEKYIKSWIEVYNDWMTQNPCPIGDMTSEDQFPWGPLQVAERVTLQIDLMAYYMHSVNFTPQWLATYLVAFAQQVEHIQQHYYEAGNNILISQAHSVTVAAILFPEFKNADKWLDNGSGILSKEVKTQFLEDGMQFELDLSYHIGEVSTFHNAMLVAQANHKEHKFPADYIESMRNSTEVVLHMTYPNYSVPGFNDTRPVSWTKNVLTRNFKKYLEMFPENEAMRYMATDGKQGAKPMELTKAFTASGYYILRNGWEKASTMMIHSNNTSDHWHSQPDNGTFELYHNGRNFFPDAGVYAYSGAGANADREWFRRTKMHNTLTLNDKNVIPAGKFLKLYTENNTDILVTENPSYPGLKHRRAIFFVDKKFFVIVDEAIGEATGKLDLNFNLCEGNDNEVVLDLAHNGAYTAFADNNNMIFRTFGNAPLSSAAFESKVSYAIGVATPRKAYAVTRTKTSGETARYISILLPVNGSTTSTTLAADFTDGGYNPTGASVRVTVDGREYLLSYQL